MDKLRADYDQADCVKSERFFDLADLRSILNKTLCCWS